jgi:anti-anti-sigma factor
LSETSERAEELHLATPSLLWCTRSAKGVPSVRHEKSPDVPGRAQPVGGGTPDPGNAISQRLRQESAMNLLGSSFFTPTDRATLTEGATAAGQVVVWLQGEYDMSTDEALCRALARAIAVGSTELLVDMSQVTFIAISTLRVIVRARQVLRHRSRSLSVRSASACAMRAMAACGLKDLLGLAPEGPIGKLLEDKDEKTPGSWREVPAARTRSFEGGGRLARSGR